MKEDKLPSGRFMEGDLKELLHFSTNFHLLPLSLPPSLRPSPPILPLPPPPPPCSLALTGLQHLAKRRLLQSAADTPTGSSLSSCSCSSASSAGRRWCRCPLCHPAPPSNLAEVGFCIYFFGFVCCCFLKPPPSNPTQGSSGASSVQNGKKGSIVFSFHFVSTA